MQGIKIPRKLKKALKVKFLGYRGIWKTKELKICGLKTYRHTTPIVKGRSIRAYTLG